MKIFDLHADTFSEIVKSGDFTEDQAFCLDYSVKAEHYIQNFAVFLSGREDDPYKTYESVLLSGKRAVTKNHDKIMLCKNIKDVNHSRRLKKTAALLSLEGGAILHSAEDVQRLADDGIIAVSLTWNYDNHLAGGALGGKTVTALGREIIKELTGRNIMLDFAHLNRKSFFDAAELTDTVLVTHTGIDSVVPQPRNLTDDQLRVIRDKNGLVGICFYPRFIGDGAVSGFLRTVDRSLELGLLENTALGSDFDGAEMSPELSKSSDLTALYKAVVRHYGTKSVADKIFYENAYRFFKDALTKRNI